MNVKIYLAGKMNGLSYEDMNAWRKEIKEKLKEITYYTTISNVTVINPVDFYNFQEVRYQTDIEVQNFDLKHVASSDIIVVNLEGLSDSIGTIIELYEAYYHNKIPVIAFGDKEIYNKLHPWVKNSITRVEKDINGVVEYIRDFYLFK